MKFEFKDDPVAGPWCEKDCSCHEKREEAIYHLDIEEGQVHVACPNCGCSPHEIPDELNMPEPLRVRVKFVPEHTNLGGWHGDIRCDCGWWWEIHPVHDD